MSDNFIVIIPEDPRHVPDPARQQRAREWMAGVAPEAESIEARTSESIEFFDCGENLERILCPACGEEISQDWWQDRMDEDCDDGYQLAAHSVPCCNAKTTLHELKYEWPQGFGRFALEAMNPQIAEINEQQKQQIEEVLGAPVRVIYQHV